MGEAFVLGVTLFIVGTIMIIVGVARLLLFWITRRK